MIQPSPGPPRCFTADLLIEWTTYWFHQVIGLLAKKWVFHGYQLWFMYTTSFWTYAYSKRQWQDSHKWLTLRKLPFVTDDLWNLLVTEEHTPQHPDFLILNCAPHNGDGSVNYLDMTISPSKTYGDKAEVQCYMTKTVELSKKRPEIEQVSTLCIMPSRNLFVQCNHKPMP